MSAEVTETCTRCKGPAEFKPTRFHYWVRYTLRLRTPPRPSTLTLVRTRDHGWHAKTSMESLDAMFSELTLCNECALAVWDFAQGRTTSP